jgi:hypothetical protein
LFLMKHIKQCRRHWLDRVALFLCCLFGLFWVTVAIMLRDNLSGFPFWCRFLEVFWSYNDWLVVWGYYLYGFWVSWPTELIPLLVDFYSHLWIIE